MQNLRSELRAYELSLPRERRKRLGQFFTQAAVARLLAALCIQSPKDRILDAMAGHGNLLDAAAERSAIIGGRTQLFGIEIDPETAKLCQRRVSGCVQQYRQESVHIVSGNAFADTTWRCLDAAQRFDVVIGNPPYVRYQSQQGKRDEIRDGLRVIANRYAPDAEKDLWTELIAGYSGLADLSVPSWILCSIVCKEDGLLALVVPRTWMNRDYSRLLRYVQLRFFRPLYIVEEHGIGWFEDALVPTTLIVSRRLSPEEASIPLHNRKDAGHSILRIGIPADAGIPGASLVGAAFPGVDPEAAFASWAATGAASNPLLAARNESVAHERHRVLTAVRSDSWAKKLEPDRSASVSTASVDVRSMIPSALAYAVSLPTRLNLISLTTLGVEIGQGLRTGCNAFFYVDELPLPSGPAFATVRTGHIFERLEFLVPRAVLRPVLRRQSEVSGCIVRAESLCGRVLDLRHWFMLEDHRAFQNDLFSAPNTHRMPAPLADYVRRAATTLMGREGQRMLIPRLSAVAPNERTNGDGVPRRWYMLPDFAPRHLPFAFVPRVNDGTPFFVGNAPEPILVDANFCTIYKRGAAPTTEALLAILNSSWVRACCEASGSPMGGGALKLEATHLRSLPIPLPSPSAWNQLGRLGQALIAGPAADRNDAINAIDELVVAAILGDAQSSIVSATVATVASLLDTFRQQRLRKGGARA